MSEKQCSKCKQVKTLDLFRRHIAGGHQSWCRECDNEYNRNRRKDPEYQQLNKQWQKDYQDWLESTSDGSVTDEAKAELRRQQNNRCYYAHCRKMLNDIWNDPAEATTEHLITRKHGGLNVLSNVVIACRYCNLSKGDSLPADWLRRQIEDRSHLIREK